MTDLLSCPNCDEIIVDLLRSYVTGTYSVRCSKCHLTGPDSEDKEDAISLWNNLSKKIEKPVE